MKPIAKIICLVAFLSWISDVTAGGVMVREDSGSVILESEPDMGMPAPARPSTSTPASVLPPTGKSPVTVYYDKVDRARAGQRLESNALRARKRSAEAQKEAAERAAKVQPQQAPPAR